MSASHCCVLPRSRRPLTGSKAPQSDLRYQIRLAEAFLKKIPWTEAAEAVRDEESNPILEVPMVPVFLPAAVTDRESGSFDKNRRSGEYIDYTWRHLPVRKLSAPLLSAEDARLASFADRMAFSNFRIRSLLRYGRSARSNAF